MVILERLLILVIGIIMLSLSTPSLALSMSSSTRREFLLLHSSRASTTTSAKISPSTVATVTSTMMMMMVVFGSKIQPALAEVVPPPMVDATKAATTRLWITGKAPRFVMDTNISDKKGNSKAATTSTEGTKRDANFLRSISDCKSQCEQSNGSDGYARTKEECLELCQDICCKTYEQCTFAITPR